MSYEIDFLPVGEGERSGDAITLRYGNFMQDGNQQIVIVIDGGTQEAGEKMVEHIGQYYKTTKVDLVISTHSDQDHSSGLLVVIDKLKVERLWMHLPWDHSQEVSSLIGDGRVSDKSIEEKIRKSLENAWDLRKLAEGKGIPITEPFTGCSYTHGAIGGRLLVLGPTKPYYEQLLPSFRGISPQKAPGIIQKGIGLLREGIKAVLETWDIETIDDNDTTSAENNSSTVLLLRIDGQDILFTADAGITALTNAADFASYSGIDLKKAVFIQVPHHGSKRNVGPTILNRIIGPKLPQVVAESALKPACVSAAKDGAPKHPSKRVVNAFTRRGTKVYTNRERPLCQHSEDVPPRPKWVTAIPLPFDANVEEE